MQTVTKMSKKSIVAIVFSVLLVLSLFMSYLSTPTVGADADAGDDKVVLGYYASWAPPADGFDPNKITHLNYSFGDVCWDRKHGNPNNEEIADGEQKTWACEDLDGEVDEDIDNGTIVLYESEVDLVELEKVKALKNENPELKTLLSVGGWTLSNNISLVAASEETRETFAQSAVDFVKKFDMDGLDLDWEYPNHDGHPGNNLGPEDTENHTKLLQAVRDAFDAETAESGNEYLVTIAGAANNAYKEKNELDKIGEIVDYIAIMAYDINGTWRGLTGHNAPLYGSEVENDVVGWTNGHVEFALNNVYNEVPAEKLVVGMAFYGHAWAGCNVDDDGKYDEDSGAYQACGTALEASPTLEATSYAYIKSIVNKDGYKYYWDNKSKVPYLYNESKGEFVSYDNVESLQYKTNYINDNNLGGAMIWDLATDDADFNLLKTVSHGLGVSSEKPTPDPEQPGETPEEDGDGTEEDGDGTEEDGDGTEEDGDGTEEDGDGTEEDGDGTEEDGDGTEEDGDGTEEDGDGTEGDGDGTEGDGDGTEGDGDGTEGDGDGTEGDGDGDGTEEDGDGTEDNVVIEDDEDKVDKVDKGDGKELPKTATNTFNWLLAGFVVIALGTGMFFIQRRKKKVTE